MSAYAFKVVAAYSNLLTSAVTPGCYCRVYSPGQWTTAPPDCLRHGFGLAVFDNLDSAIFFMSPGNRISREEVWCAEVELLRNPAPERMIANATPMSLARFDQWPNSVALDKWPDGTRLCSRVKLLERIK